MRFLPLSRNGWNDRSHRASRTVGKRKRSRLRLAPEPQRLEDRVVMATSTPFSVSDLAWTAVGPAPISNGQTPGNTPTSGRVTGLAASPTDPDLIYLAAAGGGVWKTTDGGADWTPLTDGQPTLFMGSIALAPSDPSVIYAGTGEANNSGDSFAGMGVLKSTDSGQTWTLLGQSTFNRLAISKIVVDPANPDLVYAATSPFAVRGPSTLTGGGVYKSADGGQTWTSLTSSAFPEYNEVEDLEMKPGDPGTLFAAVEDIGSMSASGLYETTDGGQTWAKVAGNFPSGSTVGRIEVAIAPSSPDVMYAAISNPATDGLLSLEKSTDGGQTWAKVAGNPGNYLGDQGDYDTVLIVNPTNPDVVYAAGSLAGGSDDEDSSGNFTGGIVESTDGGASWTDIYEDANGNGPHVDYHAAAFDAQGKLVVGNDGGVWKLADPSPSSLQWQNLNGNLAITQVTGFALDPTDPSTVYLGAQDNGNDITSGTLQWSQFFGGDGGYVQIDPKNPDSVYFEYVYDSFYRTDDGGSTTTSIGKGLIGQGNFYSYFVLDPNYDSASTSSRVLFGTNVINVSTDEGATWSTLSLLGLDGWPDNSAQTVDDIAVAPSDSNTIYATVSGVVYVSTDNGGAWTRASVSGDEVSRVVVDPDDPKIAYAVRGAFGGGKVFETANGGQTWADISGDMPDLPVNAVLQVPEAGGPNVLFLGTDAGVYASNDNGQHWARFRTGLPNAQVVQLRYDPSTGTLAAATHGRGIFETIGVDSIKINTLTLTPTEDADTREKVATFAFLDQDNTTPDDFSATIDWGDGTSSPATSVEDNGDGTYSVYGTHDYQEGGTYTFTVAVTASSGETASGTGTAQVGDLPVNASPATISGTYGEDTTYSGPVARFTDTDPDTTYASEYQVSVSWYDPGSTTPATGPATVSIDPDQPDGNHFVVNSSHLLVVGTTKVKITITGPGGSSASTETDIEAQDAALVIDPNFQPATPLDGILYTQVLTQFTDADPIPKGPSNYAVSVDWGDGSTSTSTSGALVIKTDRSGNIIVSPASGHGHPYDPGVYQMTVTVKDLSGTSTVSKTYTLTVSDADLSGQAYSYNASAGTSLTQILGSFTSADPRVMQVSPSTSTNPNTPPLSNYSALVDWGDGTDPEPATILINFDGGFVVQGTHTYAVGDRTYNYSVTFSHKLDGAGSTQVPPALTTVTGSVNVAAAPFSAIPTDLSGTSLTEGQTFSGSVATISTANALARPGDFTASVNWGDGSTGPASLSKDPTTGVISVLGSHLYSSWGTYTLTISVTGPGSRLGGAITTLSVGESAIQAAGSPISVQARTDASDLPVASFTLSAKNVKANPDQFSAQIHWGDGSVTDGRVAPDGHGGFEVLGSHQYAISGTYPIQVSIVSQGGSTASASTTASVSPKLHALSGTLAGSPSGIIAYSNPTFIGYAEPGATVSLYVVPLANPSFVPEGTATADSTGFWSIQTPSLDDGLYAVTASARTASGDLSSPMTTLMPSGSSGYVAVDTQGPTVQGVQVDPTTGTVTITFHDAVTGMSVSSLMNPANYSLSAVTRRGLRPLSVGSLAVLPPSAGSMAVAFQGLPSRASGSYVLGISASGVTDRAGNGLNVSTAYTPFPSLYGMKGQNFQARFTVSGQRVSALTSYVPQSEVTAAGRLSRFLNRRRFHR